MHFFPLAYSAVCRPTMFIGKCLNFGDIHSRYMSLFSDLLEVDCTKIANKMHFQKSRPAYKHFYVGTIFFKMETDVFDFELNCPYQ